MKSPKIYCHLDGSREGVKTFLRNIGAYVDNLSDANTILTDNPNHMSSGYLCFCITENSGKGYIQIPLKSSNQKIYESISEVYYACENNKIGISGIGEGVNVNEVTIVAGFARHFSHNVLNSLLMAGGFLKQIKASSESNEHLEMLWKVIFDKLRFIEELVNGYNDYNYVLTLKMIEREDVSSFFHDLVVAISSKNFEKAFSAYLSYHKDRFEISYEFHNNSIHIRDCNLLFLKLAFCYIIKDTVRYLMPDKEILYFHVQTKEVRDKFVLELLVKDINIPQDAINTMFKPWDHQMFIQSFDYWGLVIAQTIISKHNGVLKVENRGNDFVYTIEL